MELTELRSKEEVKQDIEATRRDTRRALRQTKTAWVAENPAVIAWQKTKLRARLTKCVVTEKARETDWTIRSHIYQVIGIAAMVGVAVGFFSKRRKKNTAKNCC